MRDATCQLQIVSGSFFWKPLFRKSGPIRKDSLVKRFDGLWPHSSSFAVRFCSVRRQKGLRVLKGLMRSHPSTQNTPFHILTGLHPRDVSEMFRARS